MSAARLVDTNVLLVAEGLHDGVSDDCRRRCQVRLIEFMREGHLVVDDGHRILTEYGHKLRGNRKEPGLGRTFYKWALEKRTVAARCTQVTITPVAGSVDGADFVEFPAHPKLADFDRSDRKFVATAAGHAAPHPPIVQAADSKWVGWAPALAEVGIAVEFLCRGDIEKTWAKKKKKKGG